MLRLKLISKLFSGKHARGLHSRAAAFGRPLFVTPIRSIPPSASPRSVHGDFNINGGRKSVMHLRHVTTVCGE